MRCLSWIVCAAAAAIVLCPSAALAGNPPISSFTIADGSVWLTLNSLMGERLSAGGGIGELTTQTGSNEELNHLFQAFIWYRSANDTREYALSNQTGSFINGNTASLYYEEPINNGATPAALSFQVKYRVIDLGTAAGQPRAMLQIDIYVTNQTATGVEFELFTYQDLDLADSSSHDTAAIASAGNPFVEVLKDDAGTSAPPVQATVTSSRRFFSHYQIGAYPTIRSGLADGAITDLTDTLPVFGPGDYTGASQWSLGVTAAGSDGATTQVSVTIDITVDPCQSDLNGDGVVDVSDFLQLLGSWGRCP